MRAQINHFFLTHYLFSKFPQGIVIFDPNKVSKSAHQMSFSSSFLIFRECRRKNCLARLGIMSVHLLEFVLLLNISSFFSWIFFFFCKSKKCKMSLKYEFQRSFVTFRKVGFRKFFRPYQCGGESTVRAAERTFILRRTLKLFEKCLENIWLFDADISICFLYWVCEIMFRNLDKNDIWCADLLTFFWVENGNSLG